jgi:hypothetical protein
MPLIRPPDVEPRDAVSVRLDRRLHARLPQCVAFTTCPTHDVVARALEHVCRTDTACAAWLARQTDHAPAGDQEAEDGPVERATVAHGATSESAGGEGAPARGRGRA